MLHVLKRASLPMLLDALVDAVYPS